MQKEIDKQTQSKFRKSQTYEKRFGKEKAKKIGKKISEGQKRARTKGKIFGFQKGYKQTKEHKEKIRQQTSGYQNCLGKHWTVKDSSKMGIKPGQMSKEKHWNWKKKTSEKTKEKIHKTKKGTGMREKNSNWQEGKSFEPYGLEFNEELKEVIRNRDRRKCVICGKTELENEEKLSVHHADYNKLNNNLNNLFSLCKKCHIKTNHNREYWIKYFKGRQYIINLK